MKKKKITAIMAVIMMAAGLSACSQSNARLEGKSGIANATHNVAANNLFLKARLISSLNILFITTAPV